MARQTPRKQELIARITELRGQGKSWGDVANIVTLDGFVDASGDEYKTTSLAAAYSKWIKSKPSMTVEPESGQTGDPFPPGMTDESETVPTVTNGMTSTPESGMTDEGKDGPTEPSDSGLTQEMRALISEFMEQEVRRIMTGITVEEIQKSGRGGTAQAVKKSFSIPLDVWNAFESRFRGGILSNHVAAALKMYLNLKPV